MIQENVRSKSILEHELKFQDNVFLIKVLIKVVSRPL